MFHARSVAALTAVLVLAGTAPAAVVRYHYVPADAEGHMVLAPGPAVKITIFGRVPYNCPPRITCKVTFRHDCTGRMVTVPLGLPIHQTPKIMHRDNRYIYDYSGYSIQVIFLADGNVDVAYNSGFFRDVEPAEGK
jgi:hypothetical protein